MTSCDAGCIWSGVGPPTCCSGSSGCSASGMFSAARQYDFETPKSVDVIPYRHTTSNIGRLGTNGRVFVPNICGQHMVMQAKKKKNAWSISTECREKEPLSRLTSALADHRSLTARMPSWHLWPHPYNFPLVVAAPQPVTVKMTSGKVGPAQQSMGHQLAPPKFLTPWKCTLPMDLWEVVAWIVLLANATGTGKIPDCKRRQLSARH